jgi:hypothetical protein
LASLFIIAVFRFYTSVLSAKTGILYSREGIHRQGGALHAVDGEGPWGFRKSGGRAGEGFHIFVLAASPLGVPPAFAASFRHTDSLFSKKYKKCENTH